MAIEADLAARLEALETRVAQGEEAMILIGRLITDQFGIDSSPSLERLRGKVDALQRECLEHGKPETARLIGAFYSSIRKPWSFFDWLDEKFS